jgi:hypothetical protein
MPGKFRRIGIRVPPTESRSKRTSLRATSY